MSSAKNHRKRSHKSYKNKRFITEQFHNRQFAKVSQQKVMKEQGNFFARLFSKFKKGDK